MNRTSRACLLSALALWLAAAHDGGPSAAQRDASASAMPAFPFRYSGRLERKGLPPVAALTRGRDTLLISAGDMIDSLYRLDEVASRHIVVTYLPLKQKQTIALSGAPSAPVAKSPEPAAEKPPEAPRTPLGTRGPACC